MNALDLASCRRSPLATLATIALLSACAPGAWSGGPPSPSEIPALEARLLRDSTDVATMVRLGAAYREAGQTEEARIVLERALAREAGEAATVALLGLTYEELGRFADARLMYARYLDLGRSRELRRELTNRQALVERRALEQAVREALAREPAPPPAQADAGTVVVFPFGAVVSDPAHRPLGRALAALLVEDLQRAGRVRVVERDRVHLLLARMGASEAALAEAATAARAATLLGAGRVVHGTIREEGGALRVEAGVISLEDATRKAAEDPRAPAADPEPALVETDLPARFLELERRLVLQIHAALGAELTPAERERLDRRPTPSLPALVAFGQGLEAEDAGDLERAAERYRRAVVLDPEFELARRRAERARQLAAAAGTAAREVARLAAQELGGANASVDAVAGMVPDPSGRDAAAEALGREGLGRRAILDLIFRRP